MWQMIDRYEYTIKASYIFIRHKLSPIKGKYVENHINQNSPFYFLFSFFISKSAVLKV